MEDEDGFLYIVDRIKELIKYKAFQVAPATLEDILLRHDAVADVGVIGIPDEEAGELPKAYIVKKPDKQINQKDIQDFVAGTWFITASLTHLCLAFLVKYLGTFYRIHTTVISTLVKRNTF